MTPAGRGGPLGSSVQSLHKLMCNIRELRCAIFSLFCSQTGKFLHKYYPKTAGRESISSPIWPDRELRCAIFALFCSQTGKFLHKYYPKNRFGRESISSPIWPDRELRYAIFSLFCSQTGKFLHKYYFKNRFGRESIFSLFCSQTGKFLHKINTIQKQVRSRTRSGQIGTKSCGAERHKIVSRSVPSVHESCFYGRTDGRTNIRFWGPSTEKALNRFGE